MYEYKYVKANLGGFFTNSNHREIIDEHAKEGYRFIQVVSTNYTSHGKPTECDIIFEKKCD